MLVRPIANPAIVLGSQDPLPWCSFPHHSELCSESSPFSFSHVLSEFRGLPSRSFSLLESACSCGNGSICAHTWLGGLGLGSARQVLALGDFAGVSVRFLSRASSLPSSLCGLQVAGNKGLWGRWDTFHKAHECENTATVVQTNVPGLESSCQKSLCSLLSRSSSSWFPSAPSGGPASEYCL